MVSLERVFKLCKQASDGSFAVHGVLTESLPGLMVDGIDGYLSLPLSSAVAQQVIDKCEVAPFGRGEQTVVDEKVRNCYQLPPTKFVINNPAFTDLVNVLLESKVKIGLGIAADTIIEAQLYKLLLYPPGGHFVSHRDSEKVSGMFGTLIIQLPCDYTGGALKLRHNGKDLAIDMTKNAAFTTQWAAFYCDVQHQLATLNSGYRLCIVYNLVQRSQLSIPLAAPVADQRIVDLHNALASWRHGAGPVPVVVWILEHRYTEMGLSWQHLKGHDHAIANLLRSYNTSSHISSQDRLHLRLQIIKRTERGGADGDGYDEFEHDEEGDPIDVQIGDLIDPEDDIHVWPPALDEKDSICAVPNLQHWSIDASDLLPKDNVLMTGDPIDEDVEHTGNEGTNVERFYQAAALVMWRNDDHEQLIIGVDLAGAVTHFVQKYNHPFVAAAGSRSETEKAVKNASMIVNQFVHQSHRHGQSTPTMSDIGALITTLCRGTFLADTSNSNGLTMMLATHVPVVVANVILEYLDSGVHGNGLQLIARLLPSVKIMASSTHEIEPFAMAMRHAVALCGWQPFAATLVCMLEGGSLASITAFMDRMTPLISNSVCGPGENGAQLQVCVSMFGEAIAAAKREMSYYSAYHFSGIANAPVSSHKWLFCMGHVLLHDAVRQSAFSVALLTLVNIMDTHLMTITNWMTSAPKDLGQQLVASGAPILPWSLAAPSPYYRQLITTAMAYLSPKVKAKPVVDQVTWMIADTSSMCSCGDCSVICAFLHSPTQQEYQFRAAEKRRRHVQSSMAREIAQHLQFHTVARGSPHTLVITKNRNVMGQQSRQQQDDARCLSALEVLLASTCTMAMGAATSSSSSSSSSAAQVSSSSSSAQFGMVHVASSLKRERSSPASSAACVEDVDDGRKRTRTSAQLIDLSED